MESRSKTSGEDGQEGVVDKVKGTLKRTLVQTNKPFIMLFAGADSRSRRGTGRHQGLPEEPDEKITRTVATSERSAGTLWAGVVGTAGSLPLLYLLTVSRDASGPLYHPCEVPRNGHLARMVLLGAPKSSFRSLRIILLEDTGQGLR